MEIILPGNFFVVVVVVVVVFVVADVFVLKYTLIR